MSRSRPKVDLDVHLPALSVDSTRWQRHTGEVSDRTKVVVVGAGFGGLAAAKELASLPVDVVLIDRQNHHLFQPLLYQVATAALNPSDIAQPIRSILAKQNNCHPLLA